MNTLKIKTTILCNTCGCSLKRTKSIKVSATNQEAATKEAGEKVAMWKKSLNGQNCKTCQTIINDVAA